MPSEASRVVGALSGDGAGHLVPSPVRKERLPKSKQQLAKEAARVLHQVDTVDCVSSQDNGALPGKFYTLPARRKHKISTDSPQSSIGRTGRRKSEELGVTTGSPPKKPPRTFTYYPKQPEKPARNSIFHIFKKSEKDTQDQPKKSNLRRSVSDATNLKSKAFGPGDDGKPIRKRTGSETEDTLSNLKTNKKQLSPIIEVTQREDYFSQANKNSDDKENINIVKNDKNVDNSKVRAPLRKKGKKEAPAKPQSVTEQLKEYIDEVDTAIFNETGVRVNQPKKENKKPEVVIIDVDKAKISGKGNNKVSKLRAGGIGKKIKQLGTKKDKLKKLKNQTEVKATITKKSPLAVKNNQVVTKNNKKPEVKNVEKVPNAAISHSPSPRIKETIHNLENQLNHSPKMIHSSQQPADRLPLTRGLTVDTMVKRLSSEKTSPPPKTNMMLSPSVTVQHNNNQPFSYIRGLSPDGSRSPQNPNSPIIYAQVVCDKGLNNSTTKQTVHTAYTNGKKHLPHSDSDEGLGYEEHSGFRGKYESDKPITHFGDNRYKNGHNGFNGNKNDDYYKDIERYDEEYPITPKFKNVGYNGFNGFDNKYNGYKTEHRIFIDSSSRGRGDGMDAKRRESLSEPHENGFISSSKLNGNHVNGNNRSDLSARRDLLESRINRRFGDKNHQSPTSYPRDNHANVNKKYVTETTSKYYRHGSTSPVGFTEKYTSETKTDKNGEQYTVESRSRKNIGENERIGYDNRYKVNDYRYNNYDNEPKSFDSQISDYRSSPENTGKHFDTSHNYKYSHSNKYVSKNDKQQLHKDREHYKSNPEILRRNYDNLQRDGRGKYQETYHDSLKREKHENRNNSTSKNRTERYFDRTDSERKDKFVDSGIENDFKRSSGEHFRTPRSSTQRREYESEDEGFASSLLIASERQHTEDNFGNRKPKRDYDSDRGYRNDIDRNDSYRQMEYKSARDYKTKSRNEYAPRERSIDDGSHYDPRIDKNLDYERSTLKKNLDRKPPKPEKKSSLDKVKQLFTRDSSKKLKKHKEPNMVREESLRARYMEYKGSRENLHLKDNKKAMSEVKSGYDYSNRRRLSTPSPSPTRDLQRNGKPEATHGSWFKSLDRLSRKKSKKNENETHLANIEEQILPKQTPAKNLRFFGDTDIESNDSIRQKPSAKTRSSLSGVNQDRTRSQSTRDLHNISEELPSPILNTRHNNHKSMLNISESEKETKGSRLNLKPPMSPSHRVHREPSRVREERGRRRRNEVSSVESSTEGDSSQQSQRSVVYLHAATVGDIPGPGYLKNGRRAASREELTSNGSSHIRPQVKTLSRSFSVLAPWKPRHYRETYDIDYTQHPKPVKNGKYEQKVTRNGTSRKESSSTLKKKANETKKSNQNISTLNRNARSKENLSSHSLKKSKEDLTKGSSSTLYKKKERQPKENSRYTRERDEKRMSSKSMSVESLGSNSRSGRRSREENRDVSRSISMPRDPEKSAGWFRMNKKSKKSLSMQRL